MTDIVPVPAAVVPPDFPAVGDPDFNGKAFTWGGAMPGVSVNLQAVSKSAETNATAAQERAVIAQAQADAALGYRNAASTSASQAATSASSASTSAQTATQQAQSASDSAVRAEEAASSVDTEWLRHRENHLGFQTAATISDFAPAVAGVVWKGVTGDVHVYCDNLDDRTQRGYAYALSTVTAGVFPGGELAGLILTFGATQDSIQQEFWSIDGGGPAYSRKYVRRTYASLDWSDWDVVLTGSNVVEKVQVLDTTPTVIRVDPMNGSLCIVDIGSGPSRHIDVAPPRSEGDQVTVRLAFWGGAWPISFSSNVVLPTSPIPTYTAGQFLTVTFLAAHGPKWLAFYAGVHTA